MHRKIAAALAALALTFSLADDVSAKAVFVLPSDKSMRTTNSTVVPGYADIAYRCSWYAINLARRLNSQGFAGFDVAGANGQQATWAAQGIVKGKTYTSVIWPGERMTHSATVVAGPCYPCSMTIVAGPLPTVPQLFISGYSGQIESGFAGNFAACSTGVNGECFDPGNEGPGYGGGRTGIHGGVHYWQTPVGSAPWPGIWRNAMPGNSVDTTVAAWASPSGNDLPDGGYRIILGQDGSNWINAPFAGTPPAWRDSIYYDPLRLSRLMWQPYYRYNYWFPGNNLPYGNYMSVNYEAHRNGARPLAFLQWFSPYFYDVGGYNNNDNRLLGDPALLAAGLAWFDSLTNHDLFGATPNCIRGGVILRGVCKHYGGIYGGNGAAVFDSAGWKYGVDSLCALGVQIIAGVCVDSITASGYSWELAYLKTKPNVTFTVERWLGTAYSLSAARALLASQVGSGRVSTLLMGSAHNFNGLVELGVLNPKQRDSVAYAIRAAGFTAIAMNAEEDSSASASDSTWWTAHQRVEPAAGGGPGLLVLAYPGYNHRGATNGHGRDSTWAVGSLSQKMPNDSTFISHYWQRNMFGLMFDEWLPPIDYLRVNNRTQSQTIGTTYRPWFGEDAPGPGGGSRMTGTIGRKATVKTGANLICISSSSLGTGQWGTASPNCPGFYQVKYLVNAFATINQLGGRTLFSLISADELTPKDIQR